jgi:polysaccharide biosynthesis protein VpsQ
MTKVKWLTLFFILFILGIILLADLGSLPSPIVMLYRFPYGDRAGHFFLFGILTFLVNSSFPRQVQIARVNIFYGSLIIATLATLEEISQLFLANRTFDLFDLIFTLLGIASADWLVHLLHKQRPTH